MSDVLHKLTVKVFGSGSVDVAGPDQPGDAVMKALIAYYSRSGVTRAAAGAIAAALRQTGQVDVTIEEIVDTTSRKGILGYLAAGKDASLGRGTIIAPPAASPAEFDVLIVGTPVWAFTLAAAVRTYCSEYCKDAGTVALFCTMGGSGDKRTFRHAEAILGKTAVARLSLVEKRVKAGDEQEFIAKVKRFAADLVASCQQ